MNTALSTWPPNAASLRRVNAFERSNWYRFTCIALMLWWIVSLYPLIATQHVEEDLRREAEEAAQATSEGSLTNQIIVVSFALLGGLYLPRALRLLRTRKEVMWPLCLLGAY